MANTLTNGPVALELPDDMLWADEFDWRPVVQNTQYTVTGALVVEAAAKQAGRPITLQGGADYAWMPRSTLLTLQQWAAQPGLVLLLSIRGEAARSVVFDHQNGAIRATPIIDYADPGSTDDYAVTLRFLEV